MTRYYCPFCSIRYQIHKSSIDGVLICGQCGDPLIKKPLINFKKIIGFVATLAFLTPLIIMIFFVVKDFDDDKTPNNPHSIVLLTFN
tara:strand:- start:1423 stop:1683 length:261 start_codon:yes stop_codon:yes gene_type:complete